MKSIFAIAALFAMLFLFLSFASAQDAATVKPPVALNPADYTRQPDVDAVVTRTANGGYLIAWKPVGESVLIYGGDKPENIQTDKTLRVASNAQSATIDASTTDNMSRRYFLLVFKGGAEDGRQIVVAERFLKLQGSANFRDLGGYRTKDGKTVRWNRIFRANALDKLTDTDLAFLDTAVGLKTVCDLRGIGEAEQAPDHLSNALQTRAVSFPIEAGVGGKSSERSEMMKVILGGDTAAVNKAMGSGYIRWVDEKAETVWGPMLRRFAAPKNLPTVFHCTAGKDRTGVGSALLLSLLGVPRSVVVADYSLTNLGYDAMMAKIKANPKILPAGFDANRIGMAMLANPEWIEKMLGHIDAKYGSVENYLKTAAKLDDATIAAIRANLLQ